MALTPALCRAARGLLDWTQEELAERAGVSRSTVRGFENGQHELHRGNAGLICAALEAAGVVLIGPECGHGPGVCLIGPQAPGADRPVRRSPSGVNE